MIAVCIATYNQETFIGQAIESVLAQQCYEPLRIYVGDDASTDGTSAVCRRYAEQDKRVVCIRREKNMGLVDNTLDLYRRILADGCEYIAMLDGDDYWTDDHKLQRQVEYLRAHPEVGLVHTGAYEETDGRRTLIPDTDIPMGDLSQRYGLAGARQTNATVLFRSKLLRRIPWADLQTQHFPVLDYPLYGLFSQRSQFAFLHTPTAVWRQHTSVSRPQTLFSFIRYTRARVRAWRWLEEQYPKHFHYTSWGAEKWLLGQLLVFFRKKLHFYLHK